MIDVRVIWDVDQAFLGLVNSLFENAPNGYIYFEKNSSNNNPKMSVIAQDTNGKYVISYDNAIGRFANTDEATKAAVIGAIEQGKWVGLITDPDNHPNVKLRSEVTWPE